MGVFPLSYRGASYKCVFAKYEAIPTYKYMSILASMVGDSAFSVLTANPTIPSFLVGALVVLVLAIIGMSCWKFGSTKWLGANS